MVVAAAVVACMRTQHHQFRWQLAVAVSVALGAADCHALRRPQLSWWLADGVVVCVCVPVCMALARIMVIVAEGAAGNIRDEWPDRV